MDYNPIKEGISKIKFYCESKGMSCKIKGKQEESDLHEDGSSEENIFIIDTSTVLDLAKKLLVTTLNDNKEVEISTLCTRCNEFSFRKLDTSLKYEMCTPGTSGKKDYDIIGLSNKKVKAGITVCYNYKTMVSSSYKVEHIVIGVADIINTLLPSPQDNSFQKCQDVSLANLNNVDSCQKEFCLNSEDMAVKLSYLIIQERYACDARKYHDMAIKGSYILPVKKWNVVSYISEVNLFHDLKDAFLKRMRCLKCDSSEDPKGDSFTVESPFCNTCYRCIFSCEDKIKKVKPQDEIRQHISSDLKDDLRCALKWIADIPGEWSEGRYCLSCENTYNNITENKEHKSFWEPGTSSVCPFVWWFGKKKRCCTICLHNRVGKTFTPELINKINSELQQITVSNIREADTASAMSLSEGHANGSLSKDADIFSEGGILDFLIKRGIKCKN